MNPKILIIDDDLAEKTQAISSGADDFFIKPQEPDDLGDCILRTQSLVRRYTELNHVREPTYSIVSCGSLIMNPERRSAFFNGSPMSLTCKEYERRDSKSEKAICSTPT